MKRGRRAFAGCNHRAGAGVYCFDNPGRKKYKRTIETETKEALLTRKSIISLAICAALLVLCLPAAPAGPTGAIKGRILDDKGAPLSGAYLYVTSPAALGVANFMTSKSGRFGILGLVPGTYKIVAEAPGFKTVTMDGVVVSSGATFTANFKMEASPLEEESTTVRPGPGLDRDSARSAVILDRDLIERLPLRRDFTALLGLVPGLIFETDTADGRMSLNGAPLTSAVLVQDGIIVTHPTDGRIMDRISTDLIDEVVIESAGHSAETGPAQGAYINVVHRPGSAATQGSLSYSASGRGPVRFALDGRRARRDARRRADVAPAGARPVLHAGRSRARRHGLDVRQLPLQEPRPPGPVHLLHRPARRPPFRLRLQLARPGRDVQAVHERPREIQGRAGVRHDRLQRTRLRGGRRQAPARGLDPQPRRRGRLPRPGRRDVRHRPEHAGRSLGRIREVQAAAPPQRGRRRQASVLRRHHGIHLGQRTAERPGGGQPDAGRGDDNPPPGRLSRRIPRVRRGRRVRNDVDDVQDLEGRQPHLQLRGRQPLHLRDDRIPDLRRARSAGGSSGSISLPRPKPP